jgi:magnesium chelatase family protein
LPIALGILAASGQIDARKLKGYEFAGELSLGGDLRPVKGALAMSLALARQPDSGRPPKLVLPEGSAQEAALVPDAEIYRAHHLLDVVRQFLPGDAQPEFLDGCGAGSHRWRCSRNQTTSIWPM